MFLFIFLINKSFFNQIIQYSVAPCVIATSLPCLGLKLLEKNETDPETEVHFLKLVIVDL